MNVIDKLKNQIGLNRYEMVGVRGITPEIGVGQSLVIGRDPKGGDVQYRVSASNLPSSRSWIEGSDPNYLLSGEFLEIYMTEDEKLRARVLSKSMQCWAFAEGERILAGSNDVLSLTFGMDLDDKYWQRLGDYPQFIVQNPISDSDTGRVIGGPRVIISTASNGSRRKFTVTLGDASEPLRR